jgi:glycosyltransferase involved in cell wall biosynthesis
MKVALLGPEGDFSPNTGMGIQRYMYELYNGLHKASKNIKKIEFGKIKFLGNGPSFAIKTLFTNFDSYDIVHNLMPVPFLNFKTKNRRDYKLITTAHDFQPLLYPQYTFDHGATLKDKLWIQLVIKPGYKTTLNSDFIIANSTQTKEEAVKLGFDKNKIFVVNLGIDRRFMEPIRSKENKREFIVGYLGALRKRKNLEFAIKAFNYISNKEIRFDIWGKKEYEYEYLASISKNKNANFKGFAPEDKIVGIYNSFDVFIFPSFHEGFGFPILEAQSRGLPVIIYKYGKIPKEVRKYCFEAESPEHMAQIIEDLKENGYNEKLRKKATEYARSFTWEKTAKETLEVYKKVLK